MGKTQTEIARTNNGSGHAELDIATTDVAEQLDALKTDFANLAAAVQNLTGAGASVVKDEAKAKVHAANDAGEAAARQALETATSGAESITRYAREKPMMALAAAAGAGLLLGMLTAPRK